MNTINQNFPRLIMKLILTLSLVLYFSVSHGSPVQRKAEVMLMGTFHFSNPGLDVVKTTQIDVSTETNQAYLTAFTKRIANSFSPTDVLMECELGSEEKLNTEYQEYLKNRFELLVNENHQIGFRVAKQASVKQLTCYDERDVQWEADALFKSLSESVPELKQEFDKVIQELTKKINQMHQQLSLAEVLAALNSEELDNQNKSLYIMTNEVGADGEGYVGADAAASWWHRNFRMYANIQKHAIPGRRLFVIGGQGHTSILKDFLKLDTKRLSKPITPHLLTVEKINDH